VPLSDARTSTLAAESAGAARRGVLALWVAALALPLALVAVLRGAPVIDQSWEESSAHFWIVFLAAVASGAVALTITEAGRRRRDARLMLIGLAFLVSAGFLGLHGLATPGVFVSRVPGPLGVGYGGEGTAAGFVLATPVGLLVAAVFAALSATRTVEANGPAIVARATLWRGGLIALMAVWAALSLARVGPLDDATPPESGSTPLTVLALAGIGLYGVAAARYGVLYTRLRAPILLAVVTAFVLLAEAMVAVAFARNWHASWWEWHVLMLTAFALIAISAQRQAPQERFSDLYLDETSAGKRDVSVVFADLSGFTSFSEHRDPREVTAMLNASFERAIPAIRAQGGEIDRLVGDAIVATFNTRGDQPDHAARASRAALDVLRATQLAEAAHPDWPRFRIGVNSGEAMVGVVGAHEGKSYTVIGDTVNVAARLQGAAPVGAVAIGAGTLRALPGARVRSLGPIAVKGKREPVDAYVLDSLD
jgi:adenylate cyclase